MSAPKDNKERADSTYVQRRNNRAADQDRRKHILYGVVGGVIAVLAIALTTVLFTALFTIALSINDGFQQANFRQVGGWSHGGFKYLTEEQFNNLKDDPLIDQWGMRRFIGMPTEVPFNKSHVEVSYADANEAHWMYCDPVEGRLPQEGTDEAATDTHVLELWHGPTSAFKDMALQMLPHLLSASLVKNQEEKTVCILVATSGDTGKGALEGFRDVDRTKILVFYPKDGVSAIQELQMVTQEGANVGVCSVVGNFDDAQTGVKRLFSDEELRERLARRGYFLSSANSINWGRVLPQIVYYISAYCDLLRDGRLELGDPVNVCVPTGNFGNILAAYYAREMGVPIDRLICASNSNNVLTDFIRTGTYDRNRTFFNTISPSMDILISSNLERLLLALTQDDEQVKDYMAQLSATGTYQVSDRVGVMYLGKMVEIANYDQLYEKRYHPYTEALLSAIPQVGEGSVKRIHLEGEVPSPSNPPTGCRFHTRCPKACDRCKTCLLYTSDAADD